MIFFQEIGGILAILAAILHITDIEFEHDYDTDGVYIRNESMMEMGQWGAVVKYLDHFCCS